MQIAEGIEFVPLTREMDSASTGLAAAWSCYGHSGSEPADGKYLSLSLLLTHVVSFFAFQIIEQINKKMFQPLF